MVRGGEFVSCAKALPANRSEKGDGDENGDAHKNWSGAWNWSKNTCCVRKFWLEILEQLSRRSVNFGNFLVGNTKTVLPFNLQRNFRHVLVNGLQP